MLEYFRSLEVERNLAIGLGNCESPQEAVQIVISAVEDVCSFEGLAFVILSPLGDLIQHRGPKGEDAHWIIQNALNTPRVELKEVYFYQPFGDILGGRGFLAVIFADRPTSLETAFLQFSCLLLSQNLRRLETTHKLSTAKKDKELLLRELKHRNKNSLQMLYNLLPTLIPPLPSLHGDVRYDITQRIAALMSLYDMVDMGKDKNAPLISRYFSTLVENIRIMTTNGIGTLILDMDVEETKKIAQERAHSIAMILHELVANSIKHSSTGPLTLRIVLTIQEGDLVLEYRDTRDGKDTIEVAAEDSQEYGSSGSGLSIISELLNRSRGIRTDRDTSWGYFRARFPL